MAQSIVSAKLIAIFLLDLLKMPSFSSGVNSKILQRIEKSGVCGAFFLGIIFALSFCPTSAVLYFGTLLPLALKTDFLGNGRILRDMGPVHRKHEVYFEFGEPFMVTDTGKEQHEQIIQFIQDRLDKWYAAEGRIPAAKRS